MCCTNVIAIGFWPLSNIPVVLRYYDTVSNCCSSTLELTHSSLSCRIELYFYCRFAYVLQYAVQTLLQLGAGRYLTFLSFYDTTMLIVLKQLLDTGVDALESIRPNRALFLLTFGVHIKTSDTQLGKLRPVICKDMLSVNLTFASDHVFQKLIRPNFCSVCDQDYMSR
jgi:hypothetical protein